VDKVVKLSKMLLGQPGSFCCLLDPVAYSECLCLLDLPLHVGFAPFGWIGVGGGFGFGRRMVGKACLKFDECRGWRMGGQSVRGLW
jgi:hypothetical protein